MAYSRHAAGRQTYRVLFNNRCHYAGIDLRGARQIAATAIKIAKTPWGRERGTVVIEQHIRGGGWRTIFRETVE